LSDPSKSLTPLFIKWYIKECKNIDSEANELVFEELQATLFVAIYDKNVNTPFVDKLNASRNFLRKIQYHHINASIALS